MDAATLLPHLARRWWVVVAVATLAVVGAALAVGSRASQQERTIHFVLRPDASVPDRELPGALDVLKSDGALVQTVLGVLDGDELLRRAAADARVTLTSGYALDATARPGSALIDSTLTGPGGPAIDRVAAAYARAASDYVGAAYGAYSLDRLGTDAGGDRRGLSAAQAIVLALILGLGLGVGLVAAELRLEPALRPLRDRTEKRAGPASDATCRAITAKGTRCRNRALDERGYCRTHLAQGENEAAGDASQNGKGEIAALGEPPRIRPAGRGPRPVRHEDGG